MTIAPIAFRIVLATAFAASLAGAAFAQAPREVGSRSAPVRDGQYMQGRFGDRRYPAMQAQPRGTITATTPNADGNLGGPGVGHSGGDGGGAN